MRERKQTCNPHVDSKQQPLKLIFPGGGGGGGGRTKSKKKPTQTKSPVKCVLAQDTHPHAEGQVHTLKTSLGASGDRVPSSVRFLSLLCPSIIALKPLPKGAHKKCSFLTGYRRALGEERGRQTASYGSRISEQSKRHTREAGVGNGV